MTRLKSPEMESIQTDRRQKAAAFFTPLLPWLALVTGGLVHHLSGFQSAAPKRPMSINKLHTIFFAMSGGAYSVLFLVIFLIIQSGR